VARDFQSRRPREFGPAEIMMAPIERFFIAMTVSGCVGLFASIAWLTVR